MQKAIENWMFYTADGEDELEFRKISAGINNGLSQRLEHNYSFTIRLSRWLNKTKIILKRK